MNNSPTFLKTYRSVIIGSLSVFLFLAAWEVLGRSGWVNPVFTSSPTMVVVAAQKVIADGSIWNHIRVSAVEFILGYAVAVVVGIAFGVLMGWYKFIDALFYPLVSAIYATPRIAFMSLLIIWLGIGIGSKVLVIFLGAVFPIMINTSSGMRILDQDLVKAARSFGANDRVLFFTVALPSSVPFIITGLRQGVARAMIGVFVGEMFAATAGVGYLIIVSGATFQTDLVFVGVSILAIAAFISMEGLRRLEKRFENWRPHLHH